MKRENLIRIFLIPGFIVCLIFQQAILIRAAPGDPDYSFGFLGLKIDNDTINNMVPRAIAQQSDGKLLVAGYYDSDAYSTRRVLLRRYNTNGSVDYSFGLSGFGVAQIYGPSIVYIYGEGFDLSVQRGGKIVVAGRGFSGLPAVWTFNANGELDAAFGSEGVVALDYPGFASAYRVLTTSQGKLLIYIPGSIGFPTRLMRLNGDGTIDLSFGVSGAVDIGINNSVAVTINQSTGQIVVGGGLVNTPALQYFHADGTADTTHGFDGIVTIPHSANCGSYTMTPRVITSLAVQPDSRIIAGGRVDTIGGCTLPSCYGNSVVRLRPNDVLDTGYGTSGFAVKCDGRVTGPKLKLVSSLSNQILVNLGTPISGNASPFKRFSASGFLNLLFTNESPADFLAQQGDGKIVTVDTSGYGDIRLARYLP